MPRVGAADVVVEMPRRAGVRAHGCTTDVRGVASGLAQGLIDPQGDDADVRRAFVPARLERKVAALAVAALAWLGGAFIAQLELRLGQGKADRGGGISGVRHGGSFPCWWCFCGAP